MKISSKLPSVILLFSVLILFLIFIPSTVSADTAQNNSSEIAITQITTGESVSGNPTIYDDRIVWESRSYIYLYNLSTSTKTQITTDKSLESCMWGPVIYGDTIVWNTWNQSIYMYNLSTSKGTKVTPDGSAIYIPAVYKDRIVWVGGDIFGNLFMYNLSTATKTQLTTSDALEGPVDIYEEWVVGAQGDIYNISGSKKAEQILNESELIVEADLRFPAIYGDRMVGWVSNSPETADICVHNITNSITTQITTNELDRGHCAIDDGCDIYDYTIVWKADHGDSADIYMYNLSTSRETQIVSNSSCSSPSIYGSRIVWAEERNGSSDIYMFTISGENTRSDTEKRSENAERNRESKTMPGLETFNVIICLLGVFVYRRK